MAVTQKIYLGDVPVIKNYLGEDKIASFGAFFEPLLIEFLIVAGGGGGGTAGIGNIDGSGGGGGAGRYLSGSNYMTQGDTESITVGGAGAAGTNGGNSIAFGVTCNGGGRGGGVLFNASNGGSGGGASVYRPTAAGANIAASGDYGDGYGVNGATSAGFPATTIGGNGGGAGGSGAGSVTSKIWLDGIYYAQGGYAGRQGASQSSLYGSGGNGADLNLGTTVGNPGVQGIIKLRYLGIPKGTGGTITQSGGYTYHTFTSNGTFTITG